MLPPAAIGVAAKVTPSLSRRLAADPSVALPITVQRETPYLVSLLCLAAIRLTISPTPINVKKNLEQISLENYISTKRETGFFPVKTSVRTTTIAAAAAAATITTTRNNILDADRNFFTYNNIR